MTPFEHFEAIWERTNLLSSLHAFIATNATSILQPDEILRSEWIARVCALDLYVHELVAQRMVEIFENRRPSPPAYLSFKIPNETVNRIRMSNTLMESSAAFDLHVRERLSILTFQDPDKIADGIRLVSEVELWNEVALKMGAEQETKNKRAKSTKKQLSLIVRRRNQIAHEGDLQPSAGREPWPISRRDLDEVEVAISGIVRAIEAVV